MAFDVVTAKQGKPHVTADQQALMQAGMLGKGRYALDALNNLACTMTDSNTLTVDTGGLMVDGRWVVNEAQTSFAIANGSQAQFRKDLAVLEITVDPSTGVTSLEEKVLQGATAATGAAAADPTYEPGDLYTGLTAVVPIARITLNGLTPTCTALLPSVADLKTIGDSVSQLKKDYVIEQGVKSNWQYVKWASGRAECYCTAQHSITKTGTLWLPEVTLPFKLVKPAKSRSKFAIAVSGGEYYVPTLYPYYPFEESSVSTVGCAASGVTKTGTITVNYIVRGYWK